MSTQGYELSPESRAQADLKFTYVVSCQIYGQQKQKGAQEAHEAVRPSRLDKSPTEIKKYLSRDQFRLYKLIWERFIASQMAPAVLDTMRVDLSNNNVNFRANGSKIKFNGFMKVYVEGSDDGTDEKENILPDMKEGETDG